MQFLHPEFLYGLLFILVPLFIHLFNFRRYKIAYFSNVKLLQHLVTQTRRESQIKQWVILLLRVVGIVALVMAFAQPYIPTTNTDTHSGKLVTLFIDNSFSMDAESQNGTFLNEVTDAAKNIIEAYSYDDDFLLVTQELTGKYSHILNKDEMLEKIDEIQISNYSHSLEEIVEFQKMAMQNSRKAQVVHYYLSDFQRNYDLNILQSDTNAVNYILQVGAKSLNNVSIDSCWFMTPILKQGYSVTLMARVSNHSDEDVLKLPIRLYINGAQVTSVPIDIKANSYAEIPLNYTIHQAGSQKGKLEINDAPITFDDQLFFTYNVSADAKITIIQEDYNRYISALYEKDSLFSTTIMNAKLINYSQILNSQLVVLDQVKDITSGLSEELQKFLNNGGNLLIFPHEEMDKTSWNTFLETIKIPTYQQLEKHEVRIGKINYESAYFKGAIEPSDALMDMPKVIQYFGLSSSNAIAEPILNLENGDPALTSYIVGNGRVILSTIAMNDNFGAAHKNAIFFIPLHNIGILGHISNRLYNTLGVDEMQVLSLPDGSNTNLFTIKSDDNNMEFVPEQRVTGQELMLYFHDQIQESGFYNLWTNDLNVGTLAFNFNRNESDLTYYSDKELEEFVNKSEGRIQYLDIQTKDLTQEIKNRWQGILLWRCFIFVALAAFLLEVLLLRFWRRTKISKN